MDRTALPRLAVSLTVVIGALAFAAPSTTQAGVPMSLGAPQAVGQAAGFVEYQIHQNVAGNYRNGGGLGANDIVWAQIEAIQDPGPNTDPPQAIFLNEACLDIVEDLKENLELRFAVTYTLAFHNHLMFFDNEQDPGANPGTIPEVCDGLELEDGMTHEGTPEDSPFGVAVLQLGAGGTPVPDPGDIRPGPPADPGDPDAFRRPWLFEHRYPTDGEVRGFACVVGDVAGHVACSAHMNFKRRAPADEPPDEPEYDPNDTTLYSAEQFREYWAAVQGLVSDHDVPVVWSADAYRDTSEIAAENPGFYNLNTEADSSDCPGPDPVDRPTVVNPSGSTRKVDHLFITHGSFTCQQAYVQPVEEMCDFPLPGPAVAPLQTTTSTTIPGGNDDCLPAGEPPEWRGTEGNGQMDHSLIRAHFDLGIGDNEAPVSVAEVDPPANGAGWHQGPVTVGLSATDDYSGVASITYSASGAAAVPSTTVPGDSAEFVVGAEGTTVVEYFATDRAGNHETPRTLVVRIDATPPTVVGVPDRPADSGDWYRAPFTVDWVGSDDSSGIADCDDPTSYSGPDTTSTILFGQCTDVAGNTGTGVFSFGYDATPPVVTAVADRDPDFNDWYNEPFTVTFDGTDATSGIDTCDAPVVYDGPDGEDLSITGGCTDRAGNAADDVFGPFRYDDTPPTAAISGGDVQVILNAVDPTMAGTAGDNLAGVWLVVVEFANPLDPTDTQTRQAGCPTDPFACVGDTSVNWVVDTSGLAGVYSVRVTAADLAGNPGTWSSPVTATIL